jgi:hypothetical protein
MRRKSEDEIFEDIVDNIGLLQLMSDAGLSETDVALHLHNCGLLDLEAYEDEVIDTRVY